MSFLLPLLAGAALGGGGGGSSSTSNSQLTNNIAFNPAINIAGGVTAPSGNANATPRSTVVTDQEPGGSTSPALSGGGYYGDDYNGTGANIGSGQIIEGVPHIALGAVAIGAAWFLLK